MVEVFNNMALQTLNVLGPFLSSLHQNWCIVGSTGLVLQGIETRTEQIEIITDAAGAKKLAGFLSRFKKTDTAEELSATMSSEVELYQIDGITVKVLSNLKVKVNEGWVRLLELISKKEEFDFNGYALLLPSLADQLKISRIFGRERDMKEAETISKFLTVKTNSMS